MVARIAGGEHEIAGVSGPAESFGTGAGVCTSTTDMYCSLVAMTVIADILAEHLDAVERVRRARRAAIERMRGVLGSDDRLQTVFQPIVSLADEEVVGVEALSRFPGPPVP